MVKKQSGIIFSLFLGIFMVIGAFSNSSNVYAAPSSYTPSGSRYIIADYGGVNIQPSGEAVLNSKTGMVEYKYILQSSAFNTMDGQFNSIYMNSTQVYMPRIEGAEFSAKILGYYHPDGGGVDNLGYDEEIKLTDDVSIDGYHSNDMLNYSVGYNSDEKIDNNKGSIYSKLESNKDISKYINTYNFTTYTSAGVTTYELTYSVPFETAKSVKYMPAFALNSWSCDAPDSYWGGLNGCSSSQLESLRGIVHADSDTEYKNIFNNSSLSDIFGKIYDYKTITDDYVDSKGQLIKNIGGIYDNIKLNDDSDVLYTFASDNSKNNLVDLLKLIDNKDNYFTYYASYDDYADEAVSKFVWNDPNKNEVVDEEENNNNTTSTETSTETPKVSSPNTGVQSNAAMYIISIVGITVFATVMAILRKAKLN